MSSSSALTALGSIKAPDGWVNGDAYMLKSYYWAGKPNDIKDMMKTDYGLEGAEPIWRHHPKYGNILFIFQAKAGGKTGYYIWNGIDKLVCRIVLTKIEEIRDNINTFGNKKGYLVKLEQVVVKPLP